MKQWAGQWSVQFLRGEDSNLQKDEDSNQKECPHLRIFSAESKVSLLYVATYSDTRSGKKLAVRRRNIEKETLQHQCKGELRKKRKLLKETQLHLLAVMKPRLQMFV